MSIFSRLFRTEAPAERRDLAEPTAFDFSIFGATSSSAGVSVSPATAMGVPAIAAGVRALAEPHSNLPLHIYRRTPEGREREDDHPAARLANGDANPWTRGPQLRELLTADAVLHGNGYAVIVRDAEGLPRELHRLAPTVTSVEIDAASGEPRYRINPAKGRQRILSLHDVLHIRAPNPLGTDGVTGESAIIRAKDAVGLLIALHRHAAQLFKNGGRPSGILSFPNSLGEAVAKRMKASWQAMTTGNQSGGTAVLEEDGKFTPLAFSSVDAQFVEIWALAITDLARVLRVPPILLMDYGRATWSNGEQVNRHFLTYSLSPWLARWAEEVTLKLIAPEDRASLYAEHNTEALLQADTAAKADAYGKYRSAGVLTANDVRKGLNLPPHQDGDRLDSPHTTPGTPAQPAAQEPGK